MSSQYVRTTFLQFLDDNSSEDVVDLTAQYDDMRGMLDLEGISPDAPWLGVDFSTDGEEPVSLTADNEKGLYREYGLLLLHICAVAKLGVGATLLARAEVLLDLFRGRSIGDITVERLTPLNTGPGATLEFEGGYVSGTITIQYRRDKAL